MPTLQWSSRWRHKKERTGNHPASFKGMNGYLFYTLGYNQTFLYLFCCTHKKVSITTPKTPLHIA